MSGGKQKQLGAYTVIEVMIVLAVSGVLFLLAATFINGKQASTAFTEGSIEFTTKLQQVVTEVQNGQYSDVAFSCQLVGSSVQINTSLTVPRGTINNCQFSGKYVYFGPSNPTSYTVALLATGYGATDYSTATALVKAADVNRVDLTKQFTIPQGLYIKSANANGGTPIYGFGFVLDPTGTGALGNHTSLVYAPAVGSADTTIDAAAIHLQGNVQAAQKVSLCVTDGQHYSTIDFGGNNSNNLTVSRNVVTTC